MDKMIIEYSDKQADAWKADIFQFVDEELQASIAGPLSLRRCASLEVYNIPV